MYDRVVGPRVSVVIPTYNRRDLLAEAVGSCLGQTFTNLEVIIVDDGSTDGTGEYVSGMLTSAWASACVRYEWQTNAGACAARNRGLHLSRGTYVQFLDSDDALYPEKIALQVERLESGDGEDAECCLCYGCIGIAPIGGETLPRIGVRCETPRDYIRTLCTGWVHGIPTTAPLWRRAFLVGRRGWDRDLTLGDDLEYHMRLLVEMRSIAFVDRELFWVRSHPGPRLSDAAGDRAKVLSAVSAHRSVVASARRAGVWDAEVRRGALRTARTLYANTLACGTRDDLLSIESWLLSLSRASRELVGILALLLGRRLAGRSAILRAHRVVLMVRQLLAARRRGEDIRH